MSVFLAKGFYYIYKPEMVPTTQKQKGSGVVAPTCDPSYLGAEGELGEGHKPGQPRQLSQALTKNKN